MSNNNKTTAKPSDWGVIFDVDGTMVDNAKYHEAAWIELGRRYNLQITPDYYRSYIHARSNDRNIRCLLGDDVSQEIIEKMSDEKEIIYRQIYRPVLREIPGLTKLLQALKKEGVRCAAASNSPPANVDMVLDELDIRDYFDVVINFTQVAKGKPDPDILFKIVEKLSLPPARCVVIEDSASGFKAAENAEMPYMVITAGAGADELKHAGGARAIHKDFTTLTPACLKGLLTLGAGGL